MVAIVGVLAAISTANYQKYRNRTRQSEAKIALSAAYSAVSGYFAENGTFTRCLGWIGFGLGTIAGGAGKNYNCISFRSGANVCGPNGGQDCRSFTLDASGVSAGALCSLHGESFFNAGLMENPGIAPDLLTSCWAGTDAMIATMTKSTYEVAATDSISPSAAAHDLWSINESKLLLNRRSGV